jgi:ABC-2 type transport system permease protein
MWQVTAVKKRLSLVAYLGWLGIKSSYEYRAAFWLQVIGMIINNSAIIFVLALLFRQFGSIHGWNIHDTLLVFGLSSIPFGIIQLLFANMFGSKLSERIIGGELDSFMLFPQSTLFHVSIRRIDVSGLGDVLSGIAYLALSGYIATLAAAGRLAIVLVIATTAMYSVSVLVQSLAFWLPGARDIGGLHVSVTLMGVNYPEPAFTGAAKVVLLGIFPGFLVGFLPAHIIHNITWGNISGFLLVTACINIAGRIAFKRGLRHYESGNLVTTNV